MDFLELASLRPGQPMAALASAIGNEWKIPAFSQLGHVRLEKKNEKKFSARLDTAQRIGILDFSTGFPEVHRIEGLHVCMLMEKALAVRPQLALQDEGEGALALLYIDRSEPGYDIEVRSNGKAIASITLRARDAAFPDVEPPDPHLTKVFDLIAGDPCVLAGGDRGPAWAGGWTFGLPPGIAQRHWPLHPEYGYPLRHAFTVHLPPEYRVRGDDLVAFSFFVGDSEENAPELEGFDPGAAENHPQTCYMEDLIARSYAGIWLTQQEFDGPLCHPPMSTEEARALGSGELDWMVNGYAALAAASHRGDKAKPGWPDEATPNLATAFPLAVALREGDPNAGKPPRSRSEGGYIPWSSDEGEKLNLVRFYEAPHVNHLGGTMYGSGEDQHFGPYYLEFHEDFAAFNFAGGDMQIDLKRMALNWSH